MPINLFKDKSDETWGVAVRLLADGKVSSAANRFYYAVFQSVKGYAVAKNLITESTIRVKNPKDPSKEWSIHVYAEWIVRTHSRVAAIHFSAQILKLRSLREQADYHASLLRPDKLKPSDIAEWNAIRKNFLNVP